MTRLEGLSPAEVRTALGLLGQRDPPDQRAAALRDLRQVFAAPGAVKAVLAEAPEPARQAFVRLAHDGPATVEVLLGRGWWGHGMLPAPLDWLQRRALVTVGPDGLVHATAEARENFRALTLDVDAPSTPAALAGSASGASSPPGSVSAASPEPAPSPGSVSAAPGESAPGSAAAVPRPTPLRVTEARTIVVAPEPAALDRALTASGAGLRAVASTVAVSAKPRPVVEAALRAAGVQLDAAGAVPADAHAPALPGTPERAVGPGGVRALLRRAVAEGRQVELTYFASSRGGAATQRTVDPWSFSDDLLRGYCHLREGERTFALDRIGEATLLPTPLDHASPVSL